MYVCVRAYARAPTVICVCVCVCVCARGGGGYIPFMQQCGAHITPNMFSRDTRFYLSLISC